MAAAREWVNNAVGGRAGRKAMSPVRSESHPLALAECVKWETDYSCIQRARPLYTRSGRVVEERTEEEAWLGVVEGVQNSWQCLHLHIPWPTINSVIKQLKLLNYGARRTDETEYCLVEGKENRENSVSGCLGWCLNNRTPFLLHTNCFIVWCFSAPLLTRSISVYSKGH